MIQTNFAACFEIRVDGKSRTYRDVKATAIEAGRYFKQTQPQSEVSIRDVRDNSITVIDGELIAALNLAAARNR